MEENRLAARMSLHHRSSPLTSENWLVHEGSARAVFDSHDPDVGVDANLLGEIIGGTSIVGGFPDGPRPDALLPTPRRAQNRASAVEPVDLHEDGSSFFRAAPHEIGRGTRNFAAADQGLNVDRA